MKDKNSEVVINPLHVMADRRLVPRVQQYLDEHSSQQAISIPQMAADLQKTYTEYSRKKQKAFRTAVFNAYSIISRTSKRKTESSDLASELETKHLEKRRKMESSGKDSDCVVKELSSESSFSSDNEEYVTYKSNNTMNSFLANMYQKSPNVSKLNTNSGSTSAISNTTGNNQSEIQASSSFAVDRKGDTSVIVENCEKNKRNDKEELVTDFVIIDDNSVASEPKTNQMENVKTSNVVIEQVETVDTKETSGKAVKTIARTGQSSKQKKQKLSVEIEKKKISVQKSSVTFKDVGGMSEKLIEVCDLVMHLKNPEIFETLGVSPPKGFLLHGPPGCGKTLVAHAIAGQFDLPFLKLSATEIVSGVSGESEEKIREVFSEAIANAPCVLFFDEIDAITSKRESTSKGMEQRIVSQLFSCMDDLNRTSSAHVLLIGATNRLDSLDPALRRAGRFDTEISLGIPGEPARKSILQVLCRNLRLFDDFDYDYLARNTPGFVGADLSALASKAALSAVKRIFMELHKKKIANEQSSPHDDGKCTADDLISGSQELEKSLDQTDVQQISTSLSNPVHSALDEALQWASRKLELSEAELSSLSVSLDDFQASLKSIQPSAKREGFATIPDVTWEDIGALKYVREELQILILAPVRHPELCSQLDLNKTSGILLVGPPGCGKTLLAKAVANESGINFISVKGPELLNMYVGESERAVRQVFERARNSAPCVIFFDELDALCPRRSDHGESGASNRVVNQLLTEMDGVEERKQVFLMAASNRPDVIDPAILRPGRLDKTLYVGLPSANEREDILKTITRSGTKPRLSADVSFQSLASDSRCEGLTGADLSALVREASVITLREYLMSPDKRESMNSEVCWKHFDAALDKIKPSVKPEDRVKYEKMRDKLCSY